MATKKIAKASKIAIRRSPAKDGAAVAILGKPAAAKTAAPQAKGVAPSKASGGEPPPMGTSAQLHRGVMALAKRCRESKQKSFANAEPALNHLAKAYGRLLGKS